MVLPWSSGVAISKRIAQLIEKIIAEPHAWQTRYAISSQRLAARPHASEEAVNRMRPARKRVFFPVYSDSLPKIRRRLVSVMR